MKIDKNLSSQILTISESLNGKGGVVAVVTTYKTYFHNFNHLASTKQGNIIYKLCFFVVAIIKSLFILPSKKIKIVHIHSASHASFYRKAIFVFLSKLFNKKVILHIHSGRLKMFYESKNYFNFITKTFNKADFIIALSENWYNFFKDIVKDKSKIKIIHNIIENNKVIKEKTIREPIKILFLGKIEEMKGVYDLLEVINNNRKIFEGKIELIIGGNGEVKKLENILDRYNLSKTVKFEGWVSGKKKEELLKECDIYILPSYFEGLPISILEAMSYKMPIISTPVGGINEIVKDKINGIIIEPGNKDDIVNSILFFIENKDAIKQMGDKSLEIVKPYFAENVINELKCLYLEVLNSGKEKQ